MNHLGHKIPWNMLADCLQLRSIQHDCKYTHYVYVEKKDFSKIKYFSECMYNTLEEFAKSDKSSTEILYEHDNCWVFQCCRGFNSGAHPAEMADEFNKMYKYDEKICDYVFKHFDK